MDYNQAVEYLYNATPQFQRIGAAAYKPGLDTALQLAAYFSNPQLRYPTIHVAGTNGKGSTCHTIAAILQSAGYKVGLFTSPHLIDFRERIKVDGKMISQEKVTRFVERYIAANVNLSPSFFELTTIMAFEYFASEKVDVAVIETGLGGRLDTTNIIAPILTVITNISFDHKAQLGNTLRQIASEKAGIIKAGVPVVIGNAAGEGVKETFVETARRVGAPITFSDINTVCSEVERQGDYIAYKSTPYGDIRGELTGDCQVENAATIINCIGLLRKSGFNIADKDVANGFANVVESTGLSGRWMKLSENPTIICDTGHNEGGWQYLSPRLRQYGKRLRMVVGFVSDKDVDTILRMFPSEATYYFTNAAIPRAMAATLLADKAARFGLKGNVYPSVGKALCAAKNDASPDETIFIGGSTFIVADALSALQ
jgi:dihydrofolate synthase/folylpolyglutamate synthase